MFDGDAPAPIAAKATFPHEAVEAPPGGYIRVGEASLAPGAARGAIVVPDVVVRWELTYAGRAEVFRHLPYDFLYRAPLPRTKLLSPYPDARLSGSVTVNDDTFVLDEWPGMIGHNWGTEHAERWIWLHANDFRGADGYFDAGLGRIKLGPLTTPWIGNAMVRLDGVSHRLGGLERIRSTVVKESSTACKFELRGVDVRVRGRVSAEARNFVGWVYADPVGPEHNTVNCSIADLELTVERKGEPPRTLACRGAAAYELGMRETDHGIALQPFPDG
ncbi:hypothetical protein ODJ79_32805 [Actinoplanes sp. KI2]|uniref:hypothetical protein n=1 Tax=Actinoplanes sp. KI2 TaxID=2983315 RepID=UPI0021D57372|nr:hypothetical protein [Actinoplanes sp. KI2]MCU7728517.1 hypothetical protein [Actinoplanes sp. KI2]